MKIIRLSQTEDREAWMEGRRTVLTSSKAKKTKPLSRGADRRPAGFWELLAENLAIEGDGESERDRGHRLENTALTETAVLYGIKLDLDPGFWVSDFSDKIACSPDAAEPGDNPTYAAEAKCLMSKNHLRHIRIAQERTALGQYGFELIPEEFRDQVLQYFIVNEHLKVLYFTFYDDLVVDEHLMHYVIVVEREQIEKEVERQKFVHLDTINQVKNLIKEMRGIQS